MNQDSRIPEFLQHMIVACNRVLTYTRGTNAAGFEENLLLQDAVLRALQIVGEAAVRVRNEDEQFLKEHGILEYTQAIGLRNRLAHEYDDVDLRVAWKTVVDGVPPLREKIIAVLYELGYRPDLDALHF